jgi:hypothetical protein
MSIPFEKSFASCEKSKYWSNKNKLKPTEVYKSSGKKYLFLCKKCNHEFEKQLNTVQKDSWCPYCCNSGCKKLCSDNNCQLCFSHSFASCEKSKYWSNKNKESPREVCKGSSKKYLFLCNNCNHEFEKSLGHIQTDGWCPYCCIPSHKLCCDNNCQLCFSHSFASCEKSKCWSNKNKENPREVFLNAQTKYWFICDECNHEFDNSLANANKGYWCPYCCKFGSSKLCNDDNCKLCFEKSFASCEKSKYWSNKNKENPRQVKRSTDKKFIFDCNICNHDFESSLNHVIDGKFCPYCAHLKLCSDNNCNYCYQNSFASYEKSKYWSNKNKENPRNIFKKTHNKYWFDCNICNNEFETNISSISVGGWCPICVNKTELKIYNILLQTYPNIKFQVKEDWCKNKDSNWLLPFDFCIPELHIIIELDGPQHFTQIMNWKSPEEQQKTDLYKEKCANDNGYSTIRLLQENVANNTNDWFIKLQNAIQSIINEPNVIHNIYVSENNEYNNYL